MILCLDSGNTRLKWGLHDGTAWLALGALGHDRLEELAGRVAAGLPPGIGPQQVIAANVAGPEVAERIAHALGSWQGRLHWAKSASRAGGVENGYRVPEQLGVDRWCALVGARQHTRQACLVVGAGTATTIDTLDASGRFLGGLILPGVELMLKSLARNTAGLPLARGAHQDFPGNTDDAIHTGCLEAQVGAIERAFARISGEPGAICLLFGGAAPLLAPHLRVPWQGVETLVLDGLCRLADAP